MAESKFCNQIAQPEPVKFIVAVTFNEDKAMRKGLRALEERHGAIEVESRLFSFEHSCYYEPEMGQSLEKQFFAFAELGDSTELVQRKLDAIEVENQLRSRGCRTVNIDPGYLELAKLVVASTKNFAHRIYLGRGIYGDVQLRFQKGKFVSQEWTYADYRTSIVDDFLHRARQLYYDQLKQTKCLN